MSNGVKRALPDSAPQPPLGVQAVGPVDPAQRIVVSVYLKAARSQEPVDLAALTARRAIELADDIEELRRFAAQYGLTVESVEPARRLVQLSGLAAQLQAAFGVAFAAYAGDKGQFFSHSGPIHVPERLADRIESVLGLDTRPIGEPQVVFAADPAAGYLPNKVSALYGFPTQVNGAGECIGILEFGGGYRDSDNEAAFAAMGLSVPEIVSVSVDGGRNSPGSNTEFDLEVALDIQVAGGCAPGAKIVVYFAPRTQAGWINAISKSATDSSNRPSVISISWGQAEDDWAHWWRFGVMDSLNAALRDAADLGISVFVADGDHLATDGSSNGKANVDFPASSPWAIGCGGTKIETRGNTITREIVWNEGANGWGTGGGVSDYFDVPAFQAKTSLPPSVNDGRRRRGVPDVAANASGQSPYRIIVDGKPRPSAGTSAVAPLWAALTARLNQAQGFALGFFLPTLYSGPGLRGITIGNNKPLRSALGYDAGAGWNACTGLGVPTSATGAFLVRLVSASSNLAAVNYGGDKNISKAAPRLYYQDTHMTIREYCSITETVWIQGVSLAQALDGSAIAAISSRSRDRLYHRVYFQTVAGEIQEYCHDGDAWRSGATLPLAMAKTPLAAVSWGYSSPHIRVYYLDTDSILREQCWDGNGWTRGAFSVPTVGGVSALAAAVRTTSLDITTIWVFAQTMGNGIQQFDHEEAWNARGAVAWGAPGTSLSAIAWGDFDGDHVRVYYQGMDGGTLREACWDGSRWQDGAFSAHTEKMSPLAATGWWAIRGDHPEMRVYYEPNSTWVQESCGPNWNIGACKLRVNPNRSTDLTLGAPSI